MTYLIEINYITEAKTTNLASTEKRVNKEKQRDITYLLLATIPPQVEDPYCAYDLCLWYQERQCTHLQNHTQREQ